MNKTSTILAATVTMGAALIVTATTSTIVTIACVTAVAASYAWLLRRLHVHYNTSEM
jgi:hypothetical protein